MEFNCYTCSVECSACGARRVVSHMTVALPLSTADDRRYFCPTCFLSVVVPGRIETRFVQQLSDDQLDVYGNPSALRASLARMIKEAAPPGRPYALTTIPELEIRCPEDGERLEPWDNYPESPALRCTACGRRNTKSAWTGEMGCGVFTTW